MGDGKQGGIHNEDESWQINKRHYHDKSRVTHERMSDEAGGSEGVTVSFCLSLQ